MAEPRKKIVKDEINALAAEQCRTPKMTQSVGVPRTAKRQSVTCRKHSGSLSESKWATPDWSYSGAITF
jgi:hypothetical protein